MRHDGPMAHVGEGERETKLEGMEQSDFTAAGDANRAQIRTLFSPPLRQAATSFLRLISGRGGSLVSGACSSHGFELGIN